MKTAIDTNILLDILIPNQTFLENSLQKLEKVTESGEIIICEIVYAELASQFKKRTDLQKFLNETKISVYWSNEDVLYEASRSWREYLEKLQKTGMHTKNCPECESIIEIQCPVCKADLLYPHRVLNDFIIGAHAKIIADQFLTRDRGFYRNYFTGLRIV